MWQICSQQVTLCLNYYIQRSPGFQVWHTPSQLQYHTLKGGRNSTKVSSQQLSTDNKIRKPEKVWKQDKLRIQ